MNIKKKYPYCNISSLKCLKITYSEYDKNDKIQCREKMLINSAGLKMIHFFRNQNEDIKILLKINR